ncbi:c-type cytochrome [Herbaspirillum sp. NPDC087042]|uniref:c-type cytochrome n=1 Tax=Herbaspirillum sp. NPDC087042 TaxID=3364004 RepID=UPI0037F8F7E1
MYRKSAFVCAALAVLSTAHAADEQRIQQGKEVFETKCSACHAIGEHKVGPRLDNLLGRRAGSVKGFEFSGAMKAANYRWDAEHLSAFLSNPQATVPGTAMAFGGIRAKEERDALIAYLKRRGK